MAEADGASRTARGVQGVGGKKDIRGAQLGAGRAFAAVAGLLLLSLAVPPLGATWIARGRVQEARTVVARIIAGAAEFPADGRVLAGPGRLPKAAGASSSSWLAASSGASRGVFAAGPDPWGNAYLVCATGDVVIALSAGTNGVVETRSVAGCGRLAAPGADAGASGAAVPLGGDDVGIVRRFAGRESLKK